MCFNVFKCFPMYFNVTLLCITVCVVPLMLWYRNILVIIGSVVGNSHLHCFKAYVAKVTYAQQERDSGEGNVHY